MTQVARGVAVDKYEAVVATLLGQYERHVETMRFVQARHDGRGEQGMALVWLSAELASSLAAPAASAEAIRDVLYRLAGDGSGTTESQVDEAREYATQKIIYLAIEDRAGSTNPFDNAIQSVTAPARAQAYRVAAMELSRVKGASGVPDQLPGSIRERLAAMLAV